MTLPLIVAIMAPVMSTVNMVPQIYKIYKTKRVRDISLTMIILLIITNLFWFLHGYFIMDLSILASCIIGFLQNFFMLTFYLLYK